MPWRSPLATPSWEPRFVIEHADRAALRPALELWAMSRQYSFGGGALFTHVSRDPGSLLVAHPAKRAPTPLLFRGGREPHRAWEALPAPLTDDGLCELIGAWLDTVEYPKLEENFDGGESRGFAVFWAHYGCDEAPTNCYGYLVVLPKWFEVHK